MLFTNKRYSFLVLTLFVLLAIAIDSVLAMPPKRMRAGEAAPAASASAAAAVADEDGGGAASDVGIVQKLIKPLTGKQIKFILEKDKELLEFTSAAYHFLEEANPDRKTYDRTVDDERLDALAGLLVGDETCAAVAFDGKHLLVATNKNEHDASEKQFDLDMHAVPIGDWSILASRERRGLTVMESPELECTPILRVTSGGVVEEIVEKPIKFRIKCSPFKLLPRFFDTPGPKLFDSLVILKPKVDSLSFKTPDGESYTTGLGMAVMQRSQILAIPPTGQILKTSFSDISIQADPFRRRLIAILTYMAVVTKLDRYPFDDAAKTAELLEEGKKEIFRQSLAWEAPKWIKSGDKDLVKRQKVDDFIQVLRKDFTDFIKLNNISKISTVDVQFWCKLIVKKVISGEIQPPAFIQFQGRDELREKIEHFMKRAYRYFVDIEELEAYIKGEAKGQGGLYNALVNRNQDTIKDLAVILDGGNNEVHAEMRILSHLLDKPGLDVYVATSKLCCCHCSLVMQQFKIKHSGRHGKIYPWHFPTKLTEDKYLMRLFGDKLYGFYNKLDGYIKLPEHGDKHRGITQKEAALRIFQSTATLSNKDLIKLQIADRKLGNKEDKDLPDKSDIDEDPLSKHQEHAALVFKEQPVPPDANSWINAILLAIQEDGGHDLPVGHRLGFKREIAEVLSDQKLYFDKIIESTAGIIEDSAFMPKRKSLRATEGFNGMLLSIIERYRDYQMYYDYLIEFKRNEAILGPRGDLIEDFDHNLLLLYYERSRNLDEMLKDFIRNHRGYEEYLQNIRNDNIAGGLLELDVLAGILGKKIKIYILSREGIGIKRFDGDRAYIREYKTLNPSAGETISILYTGGYHYNVLREIIVASTAVGKEETRTDIVSHAGGTVGADSGASAAAAASATRDEYGGGGGGPRITYRSYGADAAPGR